MAGLVVVYGDEITSHLDFKRQEQSLNNSRSISSLTEKLMAWFTPGYFKSVCVSLGGILFYYIQFFGNVNRYVPAHYAVFKLHI